MLTTHQLRRLAPLAVTVLLAAAGCASAAPRQQAAADTSATQPSTQKNSTAANNAPWTVLFDGSNLDGWTASGNPDSFAVEDGQIVIKPGNQGGWLRTNKVYRDFDLELEFNVPPNGNSGVGLRGSAQGDPAFTGFEVQIYDSHGKQPTVSDCGAVYNAIAPATQAVKPSGEWNQYRIRLIGDTLEVWLNGEHIQKNEKLDSRGIFRQEDQPLPLADRMPTGYIALQDHGDPVRFRNIRIKDLSPDPDPGSWVPLFNLRDFGGWTRRGTGSWTIEDGAIIGRDGPGHLFSHGFYDDVEIRGLVRVNERGNSGIYFRTDYHPEDKNTWPIGYEAQVDNHDPKNFTGAIYDRAPAEKLVTRDNAWFDYRIRAKGNRIQTWVNGVPMVDTTLDDFEKGMIVFQTHHLGNKIEFRDMRVRFLRDE